MAPSGLTLAQCQQFFHLPVAQAARRLHVSRPTISKVLRRHGISRWPFRKLQAQARHAQSTQLVSNLTTSTSNIAAEYVASPMINAPSTRRKSCRRSSRSTHRESHSPPASVKAVKCSTSPSPSSPPSSLSPSLISAHHSSLPHQLPMLPNSPPMQPHSELIIATPPASPSTPHSAAQQNACHSALSHQQLTSYIALPQLPCTSPPHYMPPCMSAAPCESHCVSPQLRRAKSSSPPSSCPSSLPQTPPQTPRCSSPTRSDTFAPCAPCAPCVNWTASRPSSAKAVFGGAWSRGMFTDSDEGVHFQFLAPGERVCTPKLSQNANVNVHDDTLGQFDAVEDDDFNIHFGVSDELYGHGLFHLHGSEGW